MAVDTNGSDPGITISDDEGLVDKELKRHILSLRTQIDEDERNLFVDKVADPGNDMRYIDAVEYWRIPVQQYLRGIKRLWTGGESNIVKNVDLYWQEKEIGSYQLIPPDKDGYEFSAIQYGDVTAEDLQSQYNLPSASEVPQPKTVEFVGLQSVLERTRIGHHWTVNVSKRGAPRNWDTISLSKGLPIPKSILEQTVEMADDFLQRAGIGFKIGKDLPSWGTEELENAKERDDIEVI